MLRATIFFHRCNYILPVEAGHLKISLVGHENTVEVTVIVDTSAFASKFLTQKAVL